MSASMSISTALTTASAASSVSVASAASSAAAKVVSNPLERMTINPARIVFSFLNLQGIVALYSTKKAYVKQFANDNLIWANLAKSIFLKLPQHPQGVKNCIRALVEGTLKSNDQIIDRLDSFINKITLDQNAKFTCIFKTENVMGTFSVEIQGRKDSPKLQLDKYGLVDFDLREGYRLKDGIGKGELTTPAIVEPCMVNLYGDASGHDGNTTEHSISAACASGTLRFSNTLGIGLETPLEKRIWSMTRMAVSDLSVQNYKAQSRSQNTIFGAAALCTIVLGPLLPASTASAAITTMSYLTRIGWHYCKLPSPF